ncbi:MAG: hypothetical protein PHH16_04030 [Candidatus Gracilibacteria bacterium]|nr:hypothetical protein [Candidatus Gracilibacteria bacterium]
MQTDITIAEHQENKRKKERQKVDLFMKVDGTGTGSIFEVKRKK